MATITIKRGLDPQMIECCLDVLNREVFGIDHACQMSVVAKSVLFSGGIQQ